MSDDVGQDARDFLTIIQSMALSAYARSENGSRAIGIFMASATEAARRLPVDRSPLVCALEFAEAHLPEYRSDRLAPDYVMPGWISSTNGDEVGWQPGGVEEEVDGKWGPENPRWVGLPGNRSANLEILAVLREKSPQTIDDLTSAGCGSPASVRTRLANLQKAGFVEQSFKVPSNWSLSFHPEIDRRPKT